MSLLIYAESADGKLKKVAFELASYAKKVAESLGTTVTAVTEEWNAPAPFSTNDTLTAS